jgi:cobalt-zinc-cadmium resistance protein CzcA
MIGKLVAWSLENRLIVALLVVLLAAVGGRGYARLSVDAVPDISNVQVQVLTNAPGLSPLETEQLVTRPVELAMAGLAGLETVRSVSRSGVSAVTLIFADDVPLDHARELAAQRLPAAREAVPAAAKRPELGPLTTGLGEVYHFTIRWPGHSSRDTRTLFDWDIAYALRRVPGVVEVNAWGGQTRQAEVRLRAADMQALGVTQQEVEDALQGGGRSVGGGSLERGGEQLLVRLDAQYHDLEQIGAQAVKTRAGGLPVRVRDVATVQDGDATPRGSVATADGEGETVYAMAQMVAGGNAHEVVARIKSALQEIEARLPPGAKIEPFYDRTALVDRVLGTVKRSLLEGGVIVVAVLLLFLGDGAAGLVVATAIPLSMLGAFALMQALGLSGNLMSLGAIDFGLVVDGAVVVVEGALAAMAARKLSAREALAEEGAAVGGPVAFGVVIIAVVYLPVLLLEGVEGKMFRPMAITVLFALGTALVLSFTWVPVAASVLLRTIHEREPLVVRLVRRVYHPAAHAVIDRPLVSLGLTLALVAAGVLAALGRGAEFLPRLEEGDLVVQVTRPPSVSAAEAVAGTGAIERALRRFPEVRRVVSRTGSPDVATDVMGIEQSDVFILLTHRSEWTSAHDREALVALMEPRLRRDLPGTAFSFTQPIEMRSQELLGGVKSDLGVKIFGDDLTTLTRLAGLVQQELARVPGTTDLRAEPTHGLTLVTLRPSAERMGRLGLRAADLEPAVEALNSGRMLGLLVEGERRFDLVLRLDAPPGASTGDLARAPLLSLPGQPLTLGDACDIAAADGPAQISREQARRRVLVEANVRGRDLATYVQEAQARLARIPLPQGYYLSFAGQYENLASATRRLALIVPATLAAVLALLYLTFRRAQPALLIFLNVPAAASGGVVALWLRDLPFSLPAAVGFIALFGVATLNGVVLLSAMLRRQEAGLPPRQAALDAADERLRPVLTTALVAGVGFLPMALATGTGAEVQRPLATVVMGGLVSATLLTLLVLPGLYSLTAPRAKDEAPPAPPG